MIRRKDNVNCQLRSPSTCTCRNIRNLKQSMPYRPSRCCPSHRRRGGDPTHLKNTPPYQNSWSTRSFHRSPPPIYQPALLAMRVHLFHTGIGSPEYLHQGNTPPATLSCLLRTLQFCSEVQQSDQWLICCPSAVPPHPFQYSEP